MERIKAVAMHAALGQRRCVVVDATGVGAPIVDLAVEPGAWDWFWGTALREVTVEVDIFRIADNPLTA